MLNIAQIDSLSECSLSLGRDCMEELIALALMQENSCGLHNSLPPTHIGTHACGAKFVNKDIFTIQGK